MGVATVRVFDEGLGRLEVAQFASRATGRAFAALGLPAGGRETATVHAQARGDDPSRAIDDLFDTLGIDAVAAVELKAQPTGRWELMRLDDNNNTFVMAAFTGYAKARAALAAYEGRPHKQSYWLQRG
jgi:hypothetical protein